MKKLLRLWILIFFLGHFVPMPSYAQDDVHFGTIFVEDVEYENSHDNEQINFLTDDSPEQKQLESLFQKEIGESNKKLKKLNFSRNPASKKKKSKQKTVGVIRNADLPKKIVYFLELRSFPGNSSVQVRHEAGATSAKVIDLQPGELIKINDSPGKYLHKLRTDRDNQGIWKSIATREQDIPSPQVYYDWRNFQTITSHDFPIELDILVPYGKNSVPVFKKPGAWTWRDCGLSPDLCIDNIDLHTVAYLFDATIVDTRLAENLSTDYRLFYKIGYQLKDKDGRIRHRVGWIPSYQAKRKISQLPKSLLATRSPSGEGSFGTFESDEERRKRLQKYYIFKSNMDSDNETMSRWLAASPGQTTEVFFQNIAIDGMAQMTNFSMTQDFIEGKEFDQQGLSIGFGIFAPIFIDLEIQGKFLYTLPLSANEDEDFKKSPLFRGEQWLLYTTPVSVSGTPLKFGVGAYYFSMFSSQQEFGFNSLVGFQMKALFENSNFWFGTRYGPVGADLNFRFENRELGADLGIRLNPEKKYESWSIYGDISDTSYVSTGSSANKTSFQLLSVGVRKQF